MSDTLTTILIATGTIGFSAVLIWFFSRGMLAKYLTFIPHFLKDKDGVHLHFFGARRIMPEHGDSYDIWHHRVFSLKTLEFFEGESQKGEDLELDSPFVERSMKKLSAELKTQLSFGVAAKEEDSDEEEEEYEEEEEGSESRPASTTQMRLSAFERAQERDRLNRMKLPVVKRSASESDTVKPRKLPADCIVFTELPKTDERINERFNLELVRNGRVVQSHPMKGMHDYFYKHVWLEDKPWYCFTYATWTKMQHAMMLCILDTQTGAIIFNQPIAKGTKKSGM